MHRRNNLIMLLGFALLGSISTFFLQWFTIPASGTTIGLPLVATAFNGSAAVAGVSVPLWFFVVLSIAGTLAVVVNVSGLTAVPKPVLAIVLLVPLVFYADLLFGHIKLSLGPIIASVANIATIIAISLAHRPDNSFDGRLAENAG
jgi:hypothetical protein